MGKQTKLARSAETRLVHWCSGDLDLGEDQIFFDSLSLALSNGLVFEGSPRRAVVSVIVEGEGGLSPLGWERRGREALSSVLH